MWRRSPALWVWAQFSQAGRQHTGSSSLTDEARNRRIDISSTSRSSNHLVMHLFYFWETVEHMASSKPFSCHFSVSSVWANSVWFIVSGCFFFPVMKYLQVCWARKKNNPLMYEERCCWHRLLPEQLFFHSVVHQPRCPPRVSLGLLSLSETENFCFVQPISGASCFFNRWIGKISQIIHLLLWLKLLSFPIGSKMKSTHSSK